MIVDLEDLHESEEFRADVCVIGAGAAGVTLARQLMRLGRKVLLLEAGGLDQEDRSEALMDGASDGFPYYPLDHSRLRFFGGTTSIWGGRCAQLDDIDFAHRDWVPHSGWPIRKADLTDYYRQAQGLLELEPIPGGDALWDLHGLKHPGFDPELIGTGFWQFDTAADRFAASRAEDLFTSPLVQIVLHANVTGIRVTPAGDAVDRVEYSTLGGKKGQAKASVVVLAAGGIENPRILLASNDVQKQGLGNSHDLVGRFFMEHPHARGARIETTRILDLLRLLPRSYQHEGKRYAALGRPAEALQASEGLLNTSFTISARQHSGAKLVLGKKIYLQMKNEVRPRRSNRALWHLLRRQILNAREVLGPLLGALQVKRGKYCIATVIRSEQAPNPDSRITLTTERDALGMPKPRLTWRFLDIDKHSVKATMMALGTELERLGLGTVIPESWLDEQTLEWQTDPLISNHPIGGFHHMGTTRMAASPASGVVDANGRVFGIDNLYVAGSSVFTTSGWANPTLTILALSLRLADHLHDRLRA